jgi:hypothetical protein
MRFGECRIATSTANSTDHCAIALDGSMALPDRIEASASDTTSGKPRWTWKVVIVTIDGTRSIPLVCEPKTTVR